MKRYLEVPIINDLDRKIVFLSGPRQVGKTTLSKQLYKSFTYLNYDSTPNRDIIVKNEWDRSTDLVVFDEIHKMKKWKSWLKGVYDSESIPPRLMVTGSARLDTYRKSGDSLAGRFFSYRLHPLTLKEIGQFLSIPPQQGLDSLLILGGFPEPFLNGSEQNARRWRRTHIDTIVRQDLLDLETVRDIKSIEILISLLKQRVGSLISYSSLANDLQVSIHTIKHWLQILENLYIIFPVRPFHRDITRSILKTSKYYFYDTGAVDGNEGVRLENLVAAALLREIHYLEDTDGRHGELCFIRDRESRAIDFLVVIDNIPRQLIEVKLSDNQFSPSLSRFSAMLRNIRGVQIVKNLKQNKSHGSLSMTSAAEFLSRLNPVDWTTDPAI